MKSKQEKEEKKEKDTISTAKVIEIYELILRLKDKPENKDLPDSFWRQLLPSLLASSKDDKLEEDAKTFIAIEKAHLNFGSILPGLETLGPTIRSAIEKAKSDPAYKDISDADWRQIGMDLSDPRPYCLIGFGHITPSQATMDQYVKESAESWLRLRKNHQG